MDTTDILDRLNGYDGDNIWQDVILSGLDVDEDATNAADPGYRSDVIVLTDGRTFRLERREWVRA